MSAVAEGTHRRNRIWAGLLAILLISFLLARSGQGAHAIDLQRTIASNACLEYLPGRPGVGDCPKIEFRGAQFDLAPGLGKRCIVDGHRCDQHDQHNQYSDNENSLLIHGIFVSVEGPNLL